MRIIKAPLLNGLGKTKGCELAPEAISRHLKDFYLNEGGRLPNYNNLSEIKVNNSNIEENNKKAYELIKESLSRYDKTVIIGGDHSTTYPCFKAFSDYHKDCGLIVFDAHPDCMQDFSPPTHEDFIKVLINEGKLKKENVMIIGIRNWHKDEFNFLREKKIRYLTMKDISMEGKYETSEMIMAFARRFENLYVSIDIDVIDPAFAAGTGYAEPGGFTSREFFYFLNRVKRLKNLRAVDIVEVNPKKDVNDMTSKLGAKIICELF